jgi:hypothetical protein
VPVNKDSLHKGAESSLLNEEQAASFLNCSVSLLRKFRRFGTGPVYYTVGRLIRYRRLDLDNYVRSQLSAPVAA